MRIDLITKTEAAKKFKFDRKTINGMINDGRINEYFIPKRLKKRGLVASHELERYKK